ncbi:MAG: winged helix-turn-helix transcriptional regulator, partial [Thermoplasmata archaeon]
HAWPLPISNFTVFFDVFAYNIIKKNDGNKSILTFEYNKTLDLGDHDYYFQATVAGIQVMIPPVDKYAGPSVLDVPPKMFNGGVDPIAGYENTTEFEFYAYYADLEDSAPMDIAVYVNGSDHKMSYVSGSNVTGARYSNFTTLPSGNYQFYFMFSDQSKVYRYPVAGNFSGPAVSKKDTPLNYPPELWNGTVTPDQGTNESIYTYRVSYKDKNGDWPSVAQVWINETPCTMSSVGGNYLTGMVYEYNTSLPAGTHSYYFYFQDSNNSVGRLPTLGAYIGPKVLPAPNEPPVLANGSVSPAGGNTSVLFTYSIIYKDAEQDIPIEKNVYIDGYPFTMILSTSSSPLSGWEYKYSTYLGAGNHNYYFVFNDSRNTVRHPDSGVLLGPDVKADGGTSNSAPKLSYGRVSPSSGSPSTSFTYYVYYYDADNDTPTQKHVCIDGKLYEMTPRGDQNSTTSDQGLYTYTTTLPLGNHTFYFIFSDGIATVRLPAVGNYSGPVVSVSPTVDEPPVLFYGDVTPSMGQPSTEFVYSVEYYDPEGAAPTIKIVYIDGLPYEMKLKSGSYSTGAVFEYRTTLGIGLHNYRFMFSDGTTTVRLPSTGLYYGPTVVKPNEAPRADAGPDQEYTTGPPKTVYFDGSNSTDPEGDPLLYFWDFGDGGYAYGMKAAHIYHGVGTYNVSLTVYDGKLTDVDYMSVSIIDSGQGKTQGKAPKKSAKGDAGLSTETKAVAASLAATAIIAGVVVAGTEWGWYALLTLLFPLYVRISGRRILDNFTRGKIYGYIIANPGDHYNSIKGALKLKNGALAYHLKALEREEMIKSQTDGKYKRFYPYEMAVPPRSTKMSTMRQNIIDQIVEQPGITQNEISDKMGVSHQAISYHLRSLVQLGAVNIEKKGRANHCYPGEFNGNLEVETENDLMDLT